VVNFRSASLLANWILFLLAFFEPPYWCREGNNNGYGDCGAAFEMRGTAADMEGNEQLYPYSGALLLTVSQSASIEICCVAFNFLYLLLKFADDGFVPRLFFYPGYKQRQHLSQILLLICIMTGIVLGNTVYNPLFRMLLLGTMLRNFQREFETFLKMVS